MTHLQSVDIVALRQEVQCMRDKDDGLALVAECTNDGIGEESLANMCVD